VPPSRRARGRYEVGDDRRSGAERVGSRDAESVPSYVQIAPPRVPGGALTWPGAFQGHLRINRTLRQTHVTLVLIGIFAGSQRAARRRRWVGSLVVGAIALLCSSRQAAPGDGAPVSQSSGIIRDRWNRDDILWVPRSAEAGRAAIVASRRRLGGRTAAASAAAARHTGRSPALRDSCSLTDRHIDSARLLWVIAHRARSRARGRVRDGRPVRPSAAHPLVPTCRCPRAAQLQEEASSLLAIIDRGLAGTWRQRTYGNGPLAGRPGSSGFRATAASRAGRSGCRDNAGAVAPATL